MVASNKHFVLIRELLSREWYHFSARWQRCSVKWLLDRSSAAERAAAWQLCSPSTSAAAHSVSPLGLPIPCSVCFLRYCWEVSNGRRCTYHIGQLKCFQQLYLTWQPYLGYPCFRLFFQHNLCIMMSVGFGASVHRTAGLDCSHVHVGIIRNKRLFLSSECILLDPQELATKEITDLKNSSFFNLEFYR